MQREPQYFPISDFRPYQCIVIKKLKTYFSPSSSLSYASLFFKV